MRPVHQTPEVVPLIHATYLDTIAYTDRYGFSQIDIVGDQQCAPGTDIQYEALMPRSIVIIG